MTHMIDGFHTRDAHGDPQEIDDETAGWLVRRALAEAPTGAVEIVIRRYWHRDRLADGTWSDGGWAWTAIGPPKVAGPRRGRRPLFRVPSHAYDRACRILIERGDVPEDKAVARVLSVSERTLQEWRRKGLIGGGRRARP